MRRRFEFDAHRSGACMLRIATGDVVPRAARTVLLALSPTVVIEFDDPGAVVGVELVLADDADDADDAVDAPIDEMSFRCEHVVHDDTAGAVLALDVFGFRLVIDDAGGATLRRGPSGPTVDVALRDLCGPYVGPVVVLEVDATASITGVRMSSGR